MPRRTAGNGELRDALIAYRRRFAERWSTDGSMELLAAAERGDDVPLSGDMMLRLTGDAARYGFRGPDNGARFLLVGDRLIRQD